MSMSRDNSAKNGTPNVLAVEEFIEVTGISPDHLQEIVALGWIESQSQPPQVRMFRDADVYRVRKLERICCDFELPVIGGTIIVDLLERIDRLESLVRELHDLGEA